MKMAMNNKHKVREKTDKQTGWKAKLNRKGNCEKLVLSVL
jgi:hypothetical protein